MNPETRQCQNCKQSFTIEPEDFSFYEKVGTPPPTWCSNCRLQRRLAWRNERSLHKRTCALCGKTTLAVYAEASNIVVYCNECWWSDKWDAMEHGVDFDPSRPFLEQFFQLMHRVPAVSRFGLYTSLVNSEYTNMVGYLKNCYLVTHSDYNEDCAYGSNLTNSKDCFDAYLVDKCESSYEITNCRDCYNTFFSLDCNSCHNVFFSRNCIGCNDCFGCVNLRNKQYHIFNEPYSKEEYEKKIFELYPKNLQKFQEMQKEATTLWNVYPQKYMHERHNVKITGDYVYECKNVRDSYIVAKLQDSRFCMMVTPGESMVSDSYDFTHFGVNSELFYETLMAGWCSRVRFSWFITVNGQDIEYSMWCVDNKNLFGCVGLKKKQYCILNKQYSKEEYEVLREKIIKQMTEMPYVDKKGRVYTYGEFFPAEQSPFGYNETAHTYFPLSKAEIEEQGFIWRDADERTYSITKMGDALPEIIEPATMQNEIVGCMHKNECNHMCSIAFRFIPSEIAFYKKYNLPLPRLCPNCRHAERIAKTNLPGLFNRHCGCSGKMSGAYTNTAIHFHGSGACPNTFQSPYSPEKPEIVYCEQCYQAELV